MRVKKRKRDGEIVTILWLPTDVLLNCLSYVPVRDVIIDRRVCRSWKRVIDAWRGRFSSLSVMYDGPACFDPINCPFDTSTQLVRETLRCLKSPPYESHLTELLIGDSLFQKEDFHMFCVRNPSLFSGIRSVSLKATPSTHFDSEAIEDMQKCFKGRISEITLDLKESYDDDVTDVIHTIMDEKGISCRIYFGDFYPITDEYKDNDDLMLSVLNRLSKCVIIRGLGWRDECLTYASSSPHSFDSIELTEYDVFHSEGIICPNHMNSLKTLRLDICSIPTSDDERLCKLIRLCPLLKNASLRLGIGRSSLPSDDRFPLALMRALGTKVSRIRLEISGPMLSELLHDPSPFETFRYMELIVDELDSRAANLIRLSPNLVSLCIRAKYDRIDVDNIDYALDNTEAQNLILNPCKREFSPHRSYGYASKHYDADTILLTRVSS